MRKIFMAALLLALSIQISKSDNVFTVEQPDYERSPLTGMTRRHYVEAGEYLLNGAFGYIHCLDDPMYFPKQLDKTYPHDENDTRVAKLEGLARTLFLASTLLRDNPQLTLNGIKVADYYRHQLCCLVDPESKHYVAPQTGGPCQTLIELGSIAISLKVAREVLWTPLPQEVKDRLASTLISYGEGPTIDSNWMFFNVFILSFFGQEGYQVDDDKLTGLLGQLLARYRGEGWYNDAPAYDYYSMWAYQTYGPLWAHWYGESHPEQARAFVDNEHDMAANYPYMFARDGRMNMWGRSICYRFVAAAPFSMLEYGGFDDINYGWLRMIASSTLLQFITCPDFLENGVPAMGFYGPFAPCVQIYSCRASTFWIGKAFLSLMLPEDSQYWSATENNGPWEGELTRGNVYNKFQPATNLLITNYPNCGGSEMRSWCHEKVADDWQKFRSSENYNKLSYNTEFPWMADGGEGEISMNYGTLNSMGKWEVLRLYTFRSFDDGIYRRDAVLETDSTVKYQLADIPLPDGVLRVDKVSVEKPTRICLGHYSLADKGNGFTSGEEEAAPYSLAWTDNGDYRLTLTTLSGWTGKPEIKIIEGLHPQSKKCALPTITDTLEGAHVFVTLMTWCTTVQEEPSAASTVDKVEVAADLSHVIVSMANGETKRVNF